MDTADAGGDIGICLVEDFKGAFEKLVRGQDSMQCQVQRIIDMPYPGLQVILSSNLAWEQIEEKQVSAGWCHINKGDDNSGKRGVI